ncbi:hypothetical protein NW856_13800, partial [Synechococcus sp. R3-13]
RSVNRKSIWEFIPAVGVMASPTTRKSGVAQEVGIILQPGKESLPFRSALFVSSVEPPRTEAQTLYVFFPGALG